MAPSETSYAIRWYPTQDTTESRAVYICDSSELLAFCEKAAQAKVVAVDTEFIREKTYFPKLCLIQVNAGGEIAAIDPLAIDDLSPLGEIFANPQVTKVFHACGQDLEVIYEHMGVDCAPVFDTQVAAAFLGMRQQLSYGSLVETYCDVHLPKAESLTDWSRRPLDQDQLKYAEDDVRYLPGIYDKMMDELTRADRLAWVLPEMDEVADPSHFHRNSREAYLRLKKSGSLTRKQLAVAREVCAWREDLASSRDIPRKWLCSDEVVVEICKRAPATVERLRRIRGTEGFNDADARGVVSAVRAGLACAPADYPRAQKHARSSAETDGVCDLMYAMLRVISEKSGVAPQLIATKDDLLDFISNREKSRLSRGWRWGLAGKSLSRLLSGEVGLTVVNGRIELL